MFATSERVTTRSGTYPHPLGGLVRPGETVLVDCEGQILGVKGAHTARALPPPDDLPIALPEHLDGPQRPRSNGGWHSPRLSTRGRWRWEGNDDEEENTNPFVGNTTVNDDGTVATFDQFVDLDHVRREAIVIGLNVVGVKGGAQGYGASFTAAQPDPLEDADPEPGEFAVFSTDLLPGWLNGAELCRARTVYPTWHVKALGTVEQEWRSGSGVRYDLRAATFAVDRPDTIQVAESVFMGGTLRMSLKAPFEQTEGPMGTLLDGSPIAFEPVALLSATVLHRATLPGEDPSPTALRRDLALARVPDELRALARPDSGYDRPYLALQFDTGGSNQVAEWFVPSPLPPSTTYKSYEFGGTLYEYLITLFEEGPAETQVYKAPGKFKAVPPVRRFLRAPGFEVWGQEPYIPEVGIARRGRLGHLLPRQLSVRLDDGPTYPCTSWGALRDRAGKTVLLIGTASGLTVVRDLDAPQTVTRTWAQVREELLAAHLRPDEKDDETGEEVAADELPFAVTSPYGLNDWPLERAYLHLKGFTAVIGTWHPWRDASAQQWRAAGLRRPRTHADWVAWERRGRPVPPPPPLGLALLDLMTAARSGEVPQS